MNLKVLRLYWRELLFGFLMCFLSSFGQTFFISLFAGEIKSEFNISDGEFGTLYSAGTFASAIILVWSGRLVDRLRLATMATFVLLGLGITCIFMGFIWEPFGLTVVIMCLRHFGQGLSTHTGMTSVARRFSTLRGRALSVVSIGGTLGEALLPIIIISLLAIFNWRYIWVSSGILVICVIFGMRALLATHRQAPETAQTGGNHEDKPDGKDGQKAKTGEDHTLRQVFADPGFWLRIPTLLAPSFIFTGLILHQAAWVVEHKGWSMVVWSGSYVIFAGCSLAMMLFSGHLVDKLSARRLVPFILFPLMLSCLALWASNSLLIIVIFMVFIGIGSGFVNIVGGAIWAELYGVKNLGSIRAFAQAAMVFSSGLGPIIVGLALDAEMSIETISLAAVLYCFVAALLSMFARTPKPLVMHP